MFLEFKLRLGYLKSILNMYKLMVQLTVLNMLYHGLSYFSTSVIRATLVKKMDYSHVESCQFVINSKLTV